MFHHHKFQRRYCACGKPAVYFSLDRRRYVRRPDHPLCRRCWRAQCEWLLARHP